MPIITADEIRDAIGIVRSLVPATPAYSWPLLARRIGAEVVVKHEKPHSHQRFQVRGCL